MVSLELKMLGVVNKFLGLRVILDTNFGYVLDKEVTINSLLSNHGLSSSNGIRFPIGEICNDVDMRGPKLLVATAKFG